MPRTYAGHNGYARFGIPPDSATLENEEQGGTVFVCLRPRGSWSQAWPRLAHPDA